MQAKLWRCGRNTRARAGTRSVNIFAGCEASDADSRKELGDGYQAAGETHRGALKRVYDKVKTLKAFYPTAVERLIFQTSITQYS